MTRRRMWFDTTPGANHSLIEAAMDIERALEINGRIVQAYLHQQGITDDLPDFDDITPAEAIEAARLAIDAPGRKNADGTISIHRLPPRETAAFRQRRDSAGRAAPLA